MIGLRAFVLSVSLVVAGAFSSAWIYTQSYAIASGFAALAGVAGVVVGGLNRARRWFRRRGVRQFIPVWGAARINLRLAAPEVIAEHIEKLADRHADRMRRLRKLHLARWGTRYPAEVPVSSPSAAPAICDIVIAELHATADKIRRGEIG